MKTLAVLKDTSYPFSYINHNRIAARAIILNDKNQIYLIKVDRDDIFGKLTHLETPGGGVNENEDIKIALKREIEEECGMIIDIIDELGIIEDDYNIIHRHNITYYYLCREVNRCPSHLEDYEKALFKSMDYYDIDEVLRITDNPREDLTKILYRRERIIYELVKGIIEK